MQAGCRYTCTLLRHCSVNPFSSIMILGFLGLFHHCSPSRHHDTIIAPLIATTNLVASDSMSVDPQFWHFLADILTLWCRNSETRDDTVSHDDDGGVDDDDDEHHGLRTALVPDSVRQGALVLAEYSCVVTEPVLLRWSDCTLWRPSRRQGCTEAAAHNN